MTKDPPCRTRWWSTFGPRPRRMMTSVARARRQVGLLVLVALTGCAVNPPVTPTLDLPSPTSIAPQDVALHTWWTAFDDPVLSRLVDEALANNLDLGTALARIDAARAQVRLAGAPFFPSVNLTAGGGRSRISEVGSQPLPPGFNPYSNQFNIGVELAYELDLWGKYRSGALAANNELLASRYARETVRITIAADVASTYFRLRAADAQRDVLNETLASRIDSVKLQRDRFEGGLIGELEVRQAEGERLAVLADIARTQQTIEQLETALATLTGRSPRAVFVPEVARGTTIDVVTDVPTLPPGLPSGLLERRPDIQQSEAHLAASELRIIEARADYFPNVTLTGLFGTESAALSNLFSSSATVWRFGAALLQPIIGIRRIDAAVELAAARRSEALVAYQRTVQTAFREVHDALSANRAAREVLAAEADRRNQLAQALDIARLRFDAGRTSFLEVLDVQRSLLAAETLRITAARDAKLSIVAFAKALGGGWDPEVFAAAR